MTVQVVICWLFTISNGVTNWSPSCNFSPAGTVTSVPFRRTVTCVVGVGASPSRIDPAGTLITLLTVPLSIRTLLTLTFPVPVILSGCWISVFAGILSAGLKVSVPPSSYLRTVSSFTFVSSV